MTLTGPILPGGHFTWEEAVRSRKHPELEADNRAALEASLPAQLAVIGMAGLLEPIRLRWGVVEVHSWFRFPLLNAAVGGEPSSQHPKGEATDFHARACSVDRLFRWIRYESGLKWGQLILEPRGAGVDTWVHLSLGVPFRPAASCGQVLV
jgi:hypothetical protein